MDNLFLQHKNENDASDADGNTERRKESAGAVLAQAIDGKMKMGI